MLFHENGLLRGAKTINAQIRGTCCAGFVDKTLEGEIVRLISFFLLAGMVASAAPITTTVTLTNAGNPTNVIHDGIYIGPYTLTINGQDYAALCIDYRDESNIGSSWSAYLTPVAGGNFAHTYHGSQGSNAQVSQEYEEEAYLFSQITKPGTTDQQRIDIQEAPGSSRILPIHPMTPTPNTGSIWRRPTIT